MEGNTTSGFYATAAAVLSVEMLLGLIANGFVLLITITQRKSWKQSSTIFFTSLILAHLVMNILYVPFFIIAFAAGGWIFGSTDEQKRGTCHFAFFISWYIALVISMTVAAISFDRFLFIVKPHLHKRFMGPWVALTLTIFIWLLSPVLSSFQLYVFNREFSLDWCITATDRLSFVIASFALSFIIVTIILITLVWTFCHICGCTKSHSVGETRQTSKLMGIFGAMLLIYTICFFPGLLDFALKLFIDVPVEYSTVSIICIVFINIANPVVQSYFRPEIKHVFLSRCPLLSLCLCCSCKHSIF